MLTSMRVVTRAFDGLNPGIVIGYYLLLRPGEPRVVDMSMAMPAQFADASPG